MDKLWKHIEKNYGTEREQHETTMEKWTQPWKNGNNHGQKNGHTMKHMEKLGKQWMNTHTHMGILSEDGNTR